MGVLVGTYTVVCTNERTGVNLGPGKVDLSLDGTVEVRAFFSGSIGHTCHDVPPEVELEGVARVGEVCVLHLTRRLA